LPVIASYSNRAALRHSSVLGKNSSISSFGAIKPKVIATKISAAVMPSATVLSSNSGDAFSPLRDQLDQPTGHAEQKCPGDQRRYASKPECGERKPHAVGNRRGNDTD
jgi:hypothetical protein